MTEYRFLEPVDVLLLRGNKLFGDPGSYGESLVPPWPSVAAGALRSRILVDDGVDPGAFARGKESHPTLGTPQQPGSFRVVVFGLACCHDQKDSVEMLHHLPADVVISEHPGGEVVNMLHPYQWDEAKGIQSSSPLRHLPILVERQRSKPAGVRWLRQSGWGKYLKGEELHDNDFIASKDLWSFDHRVGVGLDAATRRAAEGKLFSVQAVAMKPGVGFVVGVEGAPLPQNGLVRLGGDGRAAMVKKVQVQWIQPDYDRLVRDRRCRLILVTPGIFPRGWLLPGMTEDGRVACGPLRGTVVAAALPRSEVVSGWDLARNCPKPAQRAVPAGSVYWLELDRDVTEQHLRDIVEQGLWSDGQSDPQRRAEGFNRIQLAVWRNTATPAH